MQDLKSLKLESANELRKDMVKRIVISEESIVNRENELKSLPADSPIKEKRTGELNAEIARFKNDILGYTDHIKTLELLIGQYESQDKIA